MTRLVLVAAIVIIGLTADVLGVLKQTPDFKARFTLNNNTNSGDNREFGKQIVGRVAPCDIDYYLLIVNDVNPPDYLKIDINMTSDRVVGDFGTLFVKWRDPALPLVPFDYPDDHNYDRIAIGSSIEMEITCWFKSGQYIIGVGGGFQDYINYNMTVFRRYSPVRVLVPGFRLTIFNETRAIDGTIPPGRGQWPANDRVRYYRFFSVTWDPSNFREGTFMVVNISRVQVDYPRFPVLRVLYGALPQAFEHAPYPPDNTQPCLSVPEQQCTDNNGNFIHCNCTPQLIRYPEINRFQYSCNLTVSPCKWRYGTWYISVEYPPRFPGYWPGYVNYTIQADIYAPRLTALTRNVTFKGYVDPQLMAHYRVLVPYSDINQGDHHFMVHVDNVRGGVVDIYVHQSPGVNDPYSAPPGQNLAGDPSDSGREACVKAEYKCRTCDACNLVVPKCFFRANYWYIGIAAVTVDSSNADNLPISYTIRTNWLTDPPPRRLSAGKAVHRYLGENLYDFYVIDVPETIDTWLFVELFARCEQDEVMISLKHGDLPGEACYAQPDFWCLTGDGKEACSFMINVCELEPGPLFIAVYGHSGNSLAVSDNLGNHGTTFYQVPVEYALWADFDVAVQVENGVSYTHCVNPNQYAHYYIRADTVEEGSYLTVETTNQKGQVQTFVNYNFLAGVVPCYDHLYNCTADAEPACGDVSVKHHIRFNQGSRAYGHNDNNCLIVVPNCDFRSGVWYVGVLGNSNSTQNIPTGGFNTTNSVDPNCFTLTVTVWPAPPVHPLVIGEVVTGNVEKFTRTYLPYQYDHYKLAAQAVAGTDLVVTLTYVQDPFFEGSSAHTGDNSLQLYLNRENLATSECYRYTCTANIDGCSVCTVVVPSCEWYNFQWWISVRGNFGDNDSRGRYTLRTSVETVMAAELVNGVAVFNHAPAGLYQHYYIDINPDITTYMHVDFFTTQSGTPLHLFMNRDRMAGMNDASTNDTADSPYLCFDNIDNCTSCSCSRQIEGCSLLPGRYFFSVLQKLSETKCNNPVEYTLVVSIKPLLTEITNGVPYTAHIHAPVSTGNRFNQYTNHYYIDVPSVNVGEALVFEVANVKHGSVTAYLNHESPAGPCPCYSSIGFCRAAGKPDDCGGNQLSNLFSNTEVRNWCAVRVPYCLLRQKTGTWYFAVVGEENLTPSGLETYIGYTVEAYIERPSIFPYDRFIAIGYGPSNTFREQQVPNELYHHYRLTYNPVFEFNHLIVNVSNVVFGGLDVMFSKDIPADYGNLWTPVPFNQNGGNVGYTIYPPGTCGPIGWCGDNDHLPCFLCRTLAPEQRNVPCRAQVPYCQFLGDGTYYVSVVGITGAAFVQYEITMYLQPTIEPNAGQERNHTHFLGWTQFFRFRNVNTEPAPSGQILEVQFYRIRNIREATFYRNSDFFVWLNPGKPAGNHRAYDPEGTADLISDTDSSASWCTDHVRTSSRVSERGDARNVTVWNCVLRAANEAAGDGGIWYMTVDPSPPQLKSGQSIQQLNYSFIWRVRDTAGAPIDLTNFTNVQDAPDSTLSVYSLNQKESYRTFYVRVAIDQPDQRSKLVIQTIFQGSSAQADAARVYIQPGDIANPGICNTYSCSWPKSTDANACYDAHRYQNASCQIAKGIYYITVRQFDLTPISWRFRIRLINEPRPSIDIKSAANTTSSWRFVVPSGPGGVQGENYHHYKLTITSADLKNTTGLVLNFTNVNQNVQLGNQPLYLFVRKGYEAGGFRYLRTNVGGLQTTNNHLSDMCYSYNYACYLNGGNNFCIVQIPYCQLAPGDWFISVFNPDLDLDNVNNTAAYRGYDLSGYFQTLTALNLNVSFNTTSFSRGPFYFHYALTITQADLANYFDSYLRIRLFDISSTARIDLYTRRGDLAGNNSLISPLLSPTSRQFCLGREQARINCQGQGTECYIDYLPCGGTVTSGYVENPQRLPYPYPYGTPNLPQEQNKLVPGTYYISVLVFDVATYKLRATIIPFDTVTLGAHQLLSSVSISGPADSNRVGTSNLRYQISRFNLNDTAPTLEWWQINLPEDQIKPNSYFHIRLENVAGRAGETATVQLDVFRNDCASWFTCDTGNNDTLGTQGDITVPSAYQCQFGNDADLVGGQCSQPPSATGRTGLTGWCAIDAIGLSPCSLASTPALEYRFRVYNPSRANYTLTAWLNSTTDTSLISGENYTSVLYRWQYEHFHFDVPSPKEVNNRCTVRVDLTAICGSVEGFLQYNAFAGPDSTINLDASHSYNIGTTQTISTNPGFQNYHWQTSSASGEGCALSSCQTVFTGYPGNGARPRRDTCTMFLDNCQVKPGTYYVAVRGVSQEFPTWSPNKRIFLPAKYVITPTVTCADLQEISWTNTEHTVTWTSRCAHNDSVRYPDDATVDIGGACRDPEFISRQYYVDLVNHNVGAWVRFTLALPAGVRRGELTLSHNRTVSYTGNDGGCQNYAECIAGLDTPCHILIPTAQVQSGRWYLWANAPRGSILLVERWEPVIPFIIPAWPYTSTINARPDTASATNPTGSAVRPFHRNLQYYRLLLNENNTPKSMNFWLRGVIRNVVGGTVRLHINDGLQPYYADSNNPVQRVEENTYWHTPRYTSCVASSGSTCEASIDPCPDEWQRRNQWFITIEGVQQDCTRHAINYTFEILSIVRDTPLFTGEKKCLHIQSGELQHYFIGPQVSNDPILHTENGANVARSKLNHTVLTVFVQDNDHFNSGLQLFFNDGPWMSNHIATDNCHNYGVASTSNPTGTILTGDNQIAFVSNQTTYNAYENVCQYQELKLAIRNTGRATHFCIEPRLHTVPTNILRNGETFFSESIHPTLAGSRDFFLFEVSSGTKQADSWLYVELASINTATVWVNKNSLAGRGCSDTASCSVSPDAPLLSETPENLQSCYAHDMCSFTNGAYYLTVEAAEWYYLHVEVITDTVSIELGDLTEVQSLPKNTYRYYKFNVPKAEITPDSYLQVDIEDVHSGAVRGQIRYNAKPGRIFKDGLQFCSEGIEDPVNVDWHEATPGYSGTILGDWDQAWMTDAPDDFPYGNPTIRYSHCQLDPGTYYVQIYAYHGTTIQKPTDVDFEVKPDYVTQTVSNTFPERSVPVQFKLRPKLVTYGVEIKTLTAGSPVTGSLVSGETVFYRVTGKQDNLFSLASARVFDVSGGRVVLRAKRGYLASPGSAFGGVCQDSNPVDYTNYTSTLNPGELPNQSYSCVTDSRANYPPSSLDREYFLHSHSCAIWMDTCDWDPSTAKDWYFAITATKTDFIDRYTDVPVSFSFEVTEYKDYKSIEQNDDLQVETGTFRNDNWDIRFYKATASCVESSRVRVSVTSGEGVLVNVRDSPCDHLAQYHKQIWCDADYTKESHDFICDIEVPTRASHPLTSLTYYITVEGKNAAYELSWRAGLSNCQVPKGLTFCSGIVDYPVWKWHDNLWNQLDSEAAGFFDGVYDYFWNQPAYQGVTPECNATLRRFACYETFRRCDDNGFEVGTCRIACESVEYFCVNKFETVELPHYSCHSDRYLDHVSETCTGHREEVIFPPGAYPKTPGLTLLESSALSLTPGVLLLTIVILLQYMML